MEKLGCLVCFVLYLRDLGLGIQQEQNGAYNDKFLPLSILVHMCYSSSIAPLVEPQIRRSTPRCYLIFWL